VGLGKRVFLCHSPILPPMLNARAVATKAQIAITCENRSKAFSNDGEAKKGRCCVCMVTSYM